MVNDKDDNIVNFPQQVRGSNDTEPQFVKADPAAWVQALVEYEAAKVQAETDEWSFALMAAEPRLLETPAPDLAALRTKLEVLWGDELWGEDDESRARQIIIGDLRRFEHFSSVGSDASRRAGKASRSRSAGGPAVEKGALAEPSHEWHVSAGRDDAFWGHLGLKFPWDDKTRWWPITARTWAELYEATDDQWIAAETLTNRLVIFRMDYVQHMWLLDDGCSPPDDWDLDGTPYQGLPKAFYKALGDWAAAELDYGDDFETTCPPPLREAVEHFLDEQGLRDDPEKIETLVGDTRITLHGGAIRSYRADLRQLFSVVEQLSNVGEAPTDDCRTVVLSQSGGVLEIIYPLIQIAMVEVPLTELDRLYDE